MAAHSLKLVCMVAILCMLVLNPMATAALDCKEVETKLSPCRIYLKSSGTTNKEECCQGVNGMAASAADHQQVCKCVQNRIGGRFVPKKIKTLVEALPQECGVGFKISATADCSK
ncbi:Plant lipid transfer protein/Par allergen [Corchorus olitorius]|uniref:Non-specific lipid-transfer protein n=1 Tax=Corchorus olitorius TaxID=93759 RepID=A0A1R3J1U6_9ROSI|nr:Plant lipid transfer protein/Par allergen [Corchorus olitorius]